MTQTELIGKSKAEIERLYSEHSGKYECDEAAIVLDELYDFIESLEQSIDADKMIGLDEAAADYAKRGYSINADPFDEIREYQLEKDAFKAGAKWMAEQGVSVDGEFGIRGVETESIVNELLDGGFKMGDKVIVQIRKK